MIVKWNSDVVQTKAISKDTLLEVVAELVRSYRRGDHIIVISREVCKYIASVEGLSLIERATIEKIGQNYSQFGNIHHRASWYISLRVEVLEMTRGEKFIEVPVGMIVGSNILSRSKLLVENLIRDGWFYKFIMESIRDLFDCSHVAVDLAHGGGADIKNVFSHLIESNMIVHAVVDSDKSSPLTAKNEKLNALKSVLARHPHAIASASAPPAREVENLLPLEFMLSLQCAFKHPANKICLEIQKAEHGGSLLANDAFWSYLDIKLGVNEEELAKKTEEDRAWIDSKMMMSKLSVKTIRGYGDGIIDQIRDNNKNVSNLRDALRKQNWIDIYGEFVNDMIWVFASGRPSYT